MPNATPVLLSTMGGTYWILRLPPEAAVPRAAILSATRTDQELSVVIESSERPEYPSVDGPWAGWYARGPIPFGLTGVVAALTEPLARASCPVFVTSTYDGDLLFVPADRVSEAARVLAEAGHSIRSDGSLTS